MFCSTVFSAILGFQKVFQSLQKKPSDHSLYHIMKCLSQIFDKQTLQDVSNTSLKTPDKHDETSLLL